MPSYLYRCTQGHESEKNFRMAEKPDVIQCPRYDCSASARSIPQPAPTHFMGRGWGGKP